MKKKKQSQAEIEMSEMRKSVTELAKNYSELIKITTELMVMAKPVVEEAVKKMQKGKVGFE